MLSRCACGLYTNYGVTCVSCSIAGSENAVNLDFDIEDLIEDEATQEDHQPHGASSATLSPRLAHTVTDLEGTLSSRHSRFYL